MLPDRDSARERSGTAVLYRSRIEITRILKELAREKAVLCADLQCGERLFVSRVLHVDEQGGFVAIDYSDEKLANEAILAECAVTFSAAHGRFRAEFSVSEVQDTVFQGRAALRCAIPDTLVQAQRRAHARYPVVAGASLRCVADSAGFVPFEARIEDISLGGMGIMLYDSGVHLTTGTVLKECRVVVPGHDAVSVDLEVRYTAPMVTADGSLANRAGVRFVGAGERIKAIVDVFMVELP